MKVIRLESSNVMKLRAVDITPQESVVVVGGNNAQGKSSVLRSIEMALLGKKAQPITPVRTGANKAEICLELDDLYVQRSISPKGNTTLKVIAKDGSEYKKPQQMLDKLLGNFIDPVGFIRATPKEQSKTIERISGVSSKVKELKSKREKAYNARTEANRTCKFIASQLEDFSGLVEPETKEPIKVSSLLDKISEHERTKLQKAEHLRQANIEAERVQLEQREVVRLTKEIKRLETSIAQRKDSALEYERLSKEITIEDGSNLYEEHNKALATNRAIEQWNKKTETEERLDVEIGIVKKLTAEIDRIDHEQQTTLATSKLPVKGLEFDESGVQFQGLPFEQASQAQQLKIAIAIAIASQPKIKVMLIRDGSLLDEKSMDLIRHMANKHNTQVWIERVGKNNATVVIEEGEIAND